MTSRSSPGSASGSYRATIQNKNGSSEVLIPESPSHVTWVDSVTFGENIKGWRENLRNGLSATTSMVGTQSTVRVTNGLLLIYTNSNWPGDGRLYEMSGTLGINLELPAGNPATLDETKANSEALGRFTQRIFEVQHQFQGGVFIGELGQTVRMLRNPAQGLRRLVDDWGYTARKIRGSRVYPVAFRKKKVSENLADAWLEVSFGWKPFLHDIDDGAKAFRRYVSGQALDTIRVTGHGKVVADPSLSSTVSGISLINWQTDSRVVSMTNVIYRGALRVAARDPRQMDSKLLGFDPASFLPTAWELLPYSFLIDYFTNIGDIITGWSNLFTELSWCNRTARNSWERTVTAYGSKLLSLKTWPLYIEGVTCTPAKVVCTKRSVTRAEYNGTTVPPFAFEIPGLGSKKWLNIAALVLSRNADRKWSFD